MGSSPQIAFIVEGESYERGVVKNMQNVFFNKRLGKVECKILCLPAAKNIYMLWKDIKADEYVDIIELVRECSDQNRELLKGLGRDSFSEIYLFFDYDKHQDNLQGELSATDVLLQMIQTFDNETENGKLYVSYPMAEAIRDFSLGSCRTYSTSCYIDYQTTSYKRLSGENNPMAHVRRYTENRWANILNIYRCRLSCLQNHGDIIGILDCKKLSPFGVCSLQLAHEKSQGSYIVLSAFPEFLIDYFPTDTLTAFLGEIALPRYGLSRKDGCECKKK